MHQNMKKIIYIFIIFFCFISAIQAQSKKDLDVVNVKVVSSGKSESSALTEALRSALIQASSVFISSNTSIINDEIAKDEISMISNGSIAGYEIIAKTNNADGELLITVDVAVSVNKLGSFVESKGGGTELQGGLFAFNIKLIELNERAEEQSIRDLIEICKKMLLKSFDYQITNGDPVNSEGSWLVPLNVKIIKNANYERFTQFFYSTLKNISMNSSDIDAYVKLNKIVYSIGLFDNSRSNFSTPAIEIGFEPTKLPKDKSFEFYARNIGQYGLYKIAENNSDALSFLNQMRKDALKIGKHDLPIKVVYTATEDSSYNNIVLRSRWSKDSIYLFIARLHYFAQLVEIDNGLYKVSLSKVGDNRMNQARTIPYSLLDIKPSMPVTLLKQDYFCSFIGDFRQWTYLTRFAMPSLEYKAGNREYSAKSDCELHNSNWENKMLVLSLDKKWYSATEFYKTPFAYSVDKTYPYFEFLFGNYAKYLSELYALDRKFNPSIKPSEVGSVYINSFPIQLTLIGNEDNVVYEFSLNNRLSLDEIAKVKKYTINAKTN
jgi:hypothetical protein